MTPAEARNDGAIHGAADGEALFLQNREDYRDENDVVDGIEGIAAEACAFLRIPDDAVEPWLNAYERAARQVMLQLWRESRDEPEDDAPAAIMPPCVVTTEYQIRAVTPANGTDFSLAELRALTGAAYIQILWLDHLPGTIAVCDEEGSLRERDYNATASTVARETLVGDVLFCPAEMVR